MYPVSGVIKFPVVMGIHLLKSVISAHAELDGHNVGLLVRKMIVFTREVHGLAISRENMSRHIIVRAYLGQLFGIFFGDHPELRTSIATRTSNGRYFQF